MTQTRKIMKLTQSQPTLEGAGVSLRRAFGFGDPSLYDPFLLLDDFRSDDPEDYRAGFPWHPHRGIETITYVLQGDVEHGDSMGNRGVISAGDVQWMTAGSGIIHQEMPQGDAQGRMHGFQLWANLPRANKMMPPRYREIKSSQIPEVVLENGVRIKIICGQVGEVSGPAQEIVIDPQYLDVTIPPRTIYTHATPAGHTIFTYVIQGSGRFGEGDGSEGHAENRTLILFGDGDQIMAATQDDPLRFLLISGKPLGEPVAWRGPIVMNTEEELRTAFLEYRNGTFIKNQS
jgi:quercetin 2,3-dioxygenase